MAVSDSSVSVVGNTHFDIDILVCDGKRAAEYNASRAVEAVARPEDSAFDLHIPCLCRRGDSGPLSVKTHFDAHRGGVANLRPSPCTVG